MKSLLTQRAGRMENAPGFTPFSTISCWHDGQRTDDMATLSWPLLRPWLTCSPRESKDASDGTQSYRTCAVPIFIRDNASARTDGACAKPLLTIGKCRR